MLLYYIIRFCYYIILYYRIQHPEAIGMMMKMKSQENPVGIIRHLIFIIVKMVEIVLEVNLHLHINIIHGIEIEKLVVLHLVLRERKKNYGKKNNKGIVIFVI